MLDRNSSDAARRVTERCVPDPHHRHHVLNLLADVIDAIHDVNPRVWSISLLTARFTLNVNGWAVFAVRPGSLFIGHGMDAPELVRQIFERVETVTFKSVVETRFGWIDSELVFSNIDAFRDAAVSVAASLAHRATGATFRASHSPGVLSYLSAELSRSVPEPELAGPTDGTINPDGAAEPPGSDIQYWKISPGDNRRLWQQWLDDEYCSVGWDELGDISSLSREAFLERLNAIAPSLGWRKGALQAWHFANIPVGSFVVANDGTTEILGIGQVVGPYYFADSDHHRHQLPVRWFDVSPRKINEGGWRRTMVRLSPEKFDELRSLPSDTMPTELPPSSQSRTVFTIDDALQSIFVPRESFEQILRSLERKKNVILQGPPGVGKTFIAKRVAYTLIGFRSKSHVEQVQFHQSYSYEDFVQGWRPTTDGGFILRNGPFHEFCARAAAAPGERFVFIIDEINRGNLSKIFGELMQLIESDKRGDEWDMQLTYSQGPTDRFFVPENVYLIGMMNTADRSLAVVDYALRRRFSFHDLVPAFDQPSFKRFLHERGVPEALAGRIVSTMTLLNEHIAGDEKHLGRGFTIGHSFFCPTTREPDEAWFGEVVESEIRPLLEEYWFDRPAKVKEMLKIFCD